jgi:hypothetical protein
MQRLVFLLTAAQLEKLGTREKKYIQTSTSSFSIFYIIVYTVNSADKYIVKSAWGKYKCDTVWADY